LSDSSKTNLLRGVQELTPILPTGFVFEFRGEGRSSSGFFAWGEFVRGDRRLEIHFTRDLGPVVYHADGCRVTHGYYMREVGVAAEYPGFHDNSLGGFAALARDLRFLSDFLSGDAATLRRAASIEAADSATRGSDLMAGYVGDDRTRASLRSAFRAGRHAQVVAAAAGLVYPDRLPESEQRMLAIARRKVGG